jgi:hypothetical protein
MPVEEDECFQIVSTKSVSLASRKVSSSGPTSLRGTGCGFNREEFSGNLEEEGVG